MKKGIIRFCYRKIIDITAQKAWDKLVFESTYTEFLMQAQFYNQQKKYNTFSELLQHVPGAEKLHFLVSAAIIGYLPQLEDRMPDILDSQGKLFLGFSHYQFEIINSDIKKKPGHQVAINFLSDSMVWHDTVNSYLLVSAVNAEKMNDGVHTHLLQLQPFFGIHSIKSENDEC